MGFGPLMLVYERYSIKMVTIRLGSKPVLSSARPSGFATTRVLPIR
ncbi:hypothetical protein FP2506_00260 [Fulvimarina pelagi HTCC2506]|uniref:Uncharacterized protein n=1 Tax=Fulvimarina pelagi HTCC2506 TaxID=314231 RepID=Q0FXT3_9HYPH|nr:hypothetical protein FP2506_00260 [Fulvimarina pelagi HTCC2506]